MATAEQIKSLVKAYVDRNHEKFKTVVLQIAAQLSQSEISRVCEDAIKGSILSGKPISQRQLINLFEERYVIYEMKEVRKTQPPALL